MDVEAGMDELSLVTRMLVVEEFAAELFRKNFFFYAFKISQGKIIRGIVTSQKFKLEGAQVYFYN